MRAALRIAALGGRLHASFAWFPPLYRAIDVISCLMVFSLRRFAGGTRVAPLDAKRPVPDNNNSKTKKSSTVQPTGTVSDPELRRLVADRLSATRGTPIDPMRPASDAGTTTLRLYEYEGCPYCRVVRETLSALELDHEVRPTPRETFKKYGVVTAASRFRPEAIALAGEPASFPILVDGTRVIRDSAAIVAHLHAEYGKKECNNNSNSNNSNNNNKSEKGGPASSSSSSSSSNKKTIVTPLAFLATALRVRPEQGLLAIPSRWEPLDSRAPLELWGRETSVTTKIIRESLTSHQLPYTMRPVPFGTARAAEAEKRAAELGLRGDANALRRWLGIPPAPFLFDPETGFATGSASEALAYIKREFRTGPVPEETIADYSTAGAGAQHGTIS